MTSIIEGPFIMLTNVSLLFPLKTAQALLCLDSINEFGFFGKNEQRIL